MPDAWLVCAGIEVVIAPLDSQDISSPDVELPFRENSRCHGILLLPRVARQRHIYHVGRKALRRQVPCSCLIRSWNPTSSVPASWPGWEGAASFGVIRSLRLGEWSPNYSLMSPAHLRCLLLLQGLFQVAWKA